MAIVCQVPVDAPPVDARGVGVHVHLCWVPGAGLEQPRPDAPWLLAVSVKEAHTVQLFAFVDDDGGAVLPPRCVGRIHWVAPAPRGQAAAAAPVPSPDTTLRSLRHPQYMAYVPRLRTLCVSCDDGVVLLRLARREGDAGTVSTATLARGDGGGGGDDNGADSSSHAHNSEALPVTLVPRAFVRDPHAEYPPKGLAARGDTVFVAYSFSKRVARIDVAGEHIEVNTVDVGVSGTCAGAAAVDGERFLAVANTQQGRVAFASLRGQPS